MRTKVVVLLLVVALAAGHARAQGRVITDRAEFERQKAIYDQQKAKYDEFQSLSKVPLLAGYDLIVKGRDADQAPGKAEQLLPNYTGEKVKFQEPAMVPSMVEAGNSPRNYFHSGPIPAKRPRGASGNPLGSLPAEAPAAPAPASVTTFAAAPAAPVFTVAPAPAPAPTHALFFARGALPAAAAAAVLQAAAPAAASAAPGLGRSFFASARSVMAVFPGAPRPVPLRPLARESLFAPELPFSDFVPGPARSVAALQAGAPRPPLRPFPVYGLPGLRR